MTDLLLADLHLPPKASYLNEAFLRFCAGPARRARRVFILGDLFETWTGDDVGLGDYPSEVAALRALSDSGVAVQLQVGNRDFMVGRRFAEAAGVELLPDAAVFDIGGQPTLLAHGDQYCTDDLAYQRWRRFSRAPWAQWLYLRLPRARRAAIAGGLRGDGSRNKPAAIMDVNDEAVRRAFVGSGVARIIHGHTHRPAEHTLSVEARHCERIVLADWRPERIEYIEADAQGWRRCLL